VAVMAGGSWLGGVAGGRLVSRVDPDRFRLAVVFVGAVITIVYAVRVSW